MDQIESPKLPEVFVANGADIHMLAMHPMWACQTANLGLHLQGRLLSTGRKRLMGSSKRYGAQFDKRMDERIAARIMNSGSPSTLTPAELALSDVPMTRDPKPSPVKVWVRYPEDAIEVNAIAVAWTSRAVAVKWSAPDGAEHHAWVWAGAAERS